MAPALLDYGMTGGRTGAKSRSKRRHVVKTLAAMGNNFDVIAARIGVNENTLRARHALELKAGRDARKAKKQRAAATALSKEEQRHLDLVRRSFDSHWYDAELGNLLFGGAHSVEEALRWCGRFKNKWD
jgi:transposase